MESRIDRRDMEILLCVLTSFYGVILAGSFVWTYPLKVRMIDYVSTRFRNNAKTEVIFSGITIDGYFIFFAVHVFFICRHGHIIEEFCITMVVSKSMLAYA